MIRSSKSPTRPKDPEGHSMAHRFTIGVEEEFQIIDPATCELRSHVSQLVSAASPDIAEQVKHELHQSIVETGTRICENVGELRIEMHRTRGELVAAAERVREFRESSREVELYRQRQKDLVGRAPAPNVRHVGIPHV